MEMFFTLLPFIAIFLISRNIYEKYKEDKEKKIIIKPVSKLDKYWLYRHIKLVFFERVNLRQSTLVWRVFFGLGIITGLATFYVYYINHIENQPIPIEKMKTKIGIVKSVNLNKKVSDTLILQISDGKNQAFSVSLDEERKKRILGQKVKIYYADGWNSAFTKDNMIYEILMNGRTINKKKYNHTRRVKTNSSLFKFSINSFYFAFFSLFMMWILNRKELPIHRLNRMRLYKKNKARI